MIISITEYIDELYKYLTANLVQTYGIASKVDTNITNDHIFASMSDIYIGTMPACYLSGPYPAKCPSMVIRLDSQNEDNSFTISLCLCVCYSSISENEKAKPVEGAFNRYTFDNKSQEYTTNADAALWKTSVLYTEKIYNLLMNNKTLAIENLAAEHVTSDLPDFPYAVSTITFDTKINRSYIGQNPYDNLY